MEEATSLVEHLQVDPVLKHLATQVALARQHIDYPLDCPMTGTCFTNLLL